MIVLFIFASAMVLLQSDHLVRVSRGNPEVMAKYGIGPIIAVEVLWSGAILALIWGSCAL